MVTVVTVAAMEKFPFFFAIPFPFRLRFVSVPFKRTAKKRKLFHDRYCTCTVGVCVCVCVCVPLGQFSVHHPLIAETTNDRMYIHTTICSEYKEHSGIRTPSLTRHIYNNIMFNPTPSITSKTYIHNLISINHKQGTYIYLTITVTV